MEYMSDDFFPLTVTASPCGHSMRVESKQQEEAFEKSHRERCGADDFTEQVDNKRL
jgi:hypothetical protein